MSTGNGTPWAWFSTSTKPAAVAAIAPTLSPSAQAGASASPSRRRWRRRDRARPQASAMISATISQDSAGGTKAWAMAPRSSGTGRW